MTPEQLKKIRIEANLTQERMARELKVGTSTYRVWEAQKSFSERQEFNINSRVEYWQSQDKGDKS